MVWPMPPAKDYSKVDQYEQLEIDQQSTLSLEKSGVSDEYLASVKEEEQLALDDAGQRVGHQLDMGASENVFPWKTHR